MPHLSEKVQIELYCALGPYSDDTVFRDEVRAAIQDDHRVALYLARTYDLDTRLEELDAMTHRTNDPTIRLESKLERRRKIRLAAVINAAHAELYPS